MRQFTHPQTDLRASALWNWVLAKQGLSSENRLTDVQTAAELSLGLHAARLPSPFATAVARTHDDADLSVLLGPEHHPGLVTVRCMRKTLHTLPPSLAGIALAATRHFRIRDTANLVRKAGINGDRLDAAKEWLLDELSGGPLTHRQLEMRAEPHAFGTSEVRLALKWCWESGIVTYRNAADSWHRELRHFSLSRLSHPALAVDLDAEMSKDELVWAYFGRYGPATVADAAWWSGLGQQRIMAALRQLDVVELALPWANSSFYMLEADLDAFESAPTTWHTTSLNYLAHEDVALKAYHESRSRYLGGLSAGMVFNQIGEVLPTILLDGQVVGRWGWDHRRRAVRFRHFPQAALSPEVRAASRKLSLRLRDRLRNGHMLQSPGVISR